MSRNTVYISGGEDSVLNGTIKGQDCKSHLRRLTQNAYTVGWVCALPKEQTAAIAMLDQKHEPLPIPPNDHSIYILGSIGNHNIVIACLPFGRIGNSPSAVVATRMIATFPSIRFGLMVGIGGGIPPKVRLGDVVVSKPIDRFPGVVQWDMGKAEEGGKFNRTGSLNNPPSVLLAALGLLYTEHEMNGSKIPQYLADLKRNWPMLAPKYIRSDSLHDVLFAPSNPHRTQSRWYVTFATIWGPILAFLAFFLGWWTVAPAEHVLQRTGDPTMNTAADGDEEENDCRFCDTARVIKRKPREMRVHYGLIASGNQVIKDAKFRDNLNQRFDQNVLCVEMEAAGLMNDFPCIVIRGICDYADSHKNQAWQEHAAAVAAAFAKEVLSVVPVQEVEQLPALGILADLKEVAEAHRNIAQKQLEIQEHDVKQKLSDKQEKCLQLFRLTSGDKDVTYEWYKDRIEHRVEGTCAWFLNHRNFQSWLEQVSGPLLVSADPGCGKSVLAKYLIDEGLPRSATICYFFFKDGDQNTVRQALCALLHQLFIKNPLLIQHATVQFAKDGPGLINSTKSLWTILQNAVQDPQAGPIIIVLDALDECAEVEFVDLIQNIEDQFRNSKGSSRLKYLLTSRPYEQIVSKFKGLLATFPYVRIPGEEESKSISLEVSCVIQHRVEQLAREKDLSLEVKGHLKDLLLQITHRTYLWVYLVFEYIGAEGFKMTTKGVESTIATLPNSINQAYEQILNKSKERSIVQKALSIILAASRPLTLSEMNIAMEIDSKSESTRDLDLEEEAYFKLRLRSWCGLFVSIYHSKVYFLHQTAREFLLSDLPSSTSIPTELKWHHSITARYAHTVLADICVRYLNFFNSDINLAESNEDDRRIDKQTFIDYSAQFWSLHLHKACIGNDDAAIAPLALGICDPHLNAYSIWFEIYWRTTSMRFTRFSTGLLVASYFGHRAIVLSLLNKADDLEAEDSEYGQTPLSWAAKNGHDAVVKLLLEKGADLESNDSEYNQTPLSWAAENGHNAVVKLLLKKGADLESKDIYGQTPLLWAAKKGHDAVVKLMLEKDANLESKDIYGQTPLSWAAERGHDAVVKLLLKKDANLESKDIYGQTPLSWAAERGHDAVVKLLVVKGADLEAKDSEYSWTPLSWAAERGHDAVVKLLVENGADLEAKDKNDRTPLLWAAEKGHDAVVKLMLEKDANLESKDIYGQTPLSWAAERGHDAVVKLLLKKGANLESKDIYGQTLLSWAAENGHDAVVKLLVEKGADLEAKDSEYSRTPLSWAAERGHDAVVKLLVENGADLEAKDKNGWTPLSWATENGHDAVVKLLIDTVRY